MSEYLTDLFRILDAAANRTREGMRVVEDFVRFHLNDEHLSHRLKSHRHELAAILSNLPAISFLSARDTLHDVGTTISTTAESERASLKDVISAAFKRIQEALRTLEEYSKLIDPAIGGQFEQLRYQIYTTEKAVIVTESAVHRLEKQSLYLVITGSSCSTGFKEVVRSALSAGVRLFQLREKSLEDRELIHRARQLRAWTAAAKATLIINDRPDIAQLCSADGVHVGQHELSVQDARRIIGPDRLVGVSTHSIEQARQAVLDGADYIGVGPTFPSSTKSFDQFTGLNLIRDVAAEIRLPWFAIGGIHRDNIRSVVQSGATRVAVSHSICSVEDPESAAKQLMAALTKS